MIAIHTKYIPPTNTKGSRIKAYTVGYGEQKGFNVTISYPHEHSYEVSHFQAVKALVEKHKLDWDLNNHVGVPIASGIYLIHIEIPEVGERVLKFLGGVRQVDLQNL